MTTPTASIDARRQRWKRVLGFVAGAIVVLCIVFDWNWLRGPLERYLTDRSHRSVRIADFHVSFSWSLAPTFRLRGVRIENAPWADPQPFIVAGELSATCRLGSLFDHHPIITRLVLIDADVDLERQADGLRNWRLTKPDDRGPGLVKIFAIEPVRTRIRFIHRGTDLDVRLGSTPLLAPEAIAARPTADRDPGERLSDDAARTLTQEIAFDGRYRGAPFDGKVRAGPSITFQGTGQAFALRGSASSGRLRLDVDGTVGDVVQHARGDVGVVLQGSTFSEASAFVHGRLPDTAAFRLRGRLTMQPESIEMPNLDLTMGHSDLNGAVTWFDATRPHRLTATLISKRVEVGDLGWGRRIPDAPPTSAAKPGGAAAAPGDPIREAASDATSPDARVDTAVDLRWTADRIGGARLPPVRDLKIDAHLAARLLVVSPISAAVAGGEVDGALTVDMTREQRVVRLRASAHDLALKQLVHGAIQQRIDGRVDARLELSGSGNDLAALLGSARGSAAGSLEQGAMTRRLAAELALNGVQLLRSIFGGGDMIPIRCASADFDFERGRGSARHLVIDTDRTHVVGTGTVDLPGRRFALRLTPDPGDTRLLQLHKSIVVQGKPGEIGLSLEAAGNVKDDRCVSRGITARADPPDIPRR